MPTMYQCISVTSTPHTSPLTVLYSYSLATLWVFFFLNLSICVIQSMLSAVKG